MAHGGFLVGRQLGHRFSSAFDDKQWIVSESMTSTRRLSNVSSDLAEKCGQVLPILCHRNDRNKSRAAVSDASSFERTQQFLIVGCVAGISAVCRRRGKT